MFYTWDLYYKDIQICIESSMRSDNDINLNIFMTTNAQRLNHTDYLEFIWVKTCQKWQIQFKRKWFFIFIFASLFYKRKSKNIFLKKSLVVAIYMCVCVLPKRKTELEGLHINTRYKSFEFLHCTLLSTSQKVLIIFTYLHVSSRMTIGSLLLCWITGLFWFSTSHQVDIWS